MNEQNRTAEDVGGERAGGVRADGERAGGERADGERADGERAGGDGAGGARDPRVYFAAERTMLAWIRTGLALMGFGFVVARFGLFLREFAPTPPPAAVAHGADPARPGWSLWLGTVLVVMGVWVNVTAAVNHFRFRSRFERGDSFLTPRGTMTIVLSMLLALLGIAMTVYLVAVGRG